MKTVFITLAGGLSIILLSSFGIKNYDGFSNDPSSKVELNSANENYELQENLSFDSDVSTFDAGKIIKIEDIKVYEVEEEVNLGFDAEDYLPEDFNPYEGLNTNAEMNFEEKLMFTAVFGDVTKEEIIEIEDIILYEIDETM